MTNIKNIIIVSVLFFNLIIKAQNTLPKDSTIELDIQVLVDDKIITDSTYILDVIDKTTDNYSRLNVSDRFVLTLNYNTNYELSIGYKKTNIKVITIDTNAPKDRWYIKTSVLLKTSKRKKRIIAGSIIFDNNTKNFIKKKAD